jgi:hypothetical protein
VEYEFIYETVEVNGLTLATNATTRSAISALHVLQPRVLYQRSLPPSARQIFESNSDRKATTLQSNVVNLVAPSPATKVIGRMPKTKDRNSGKHGHRLKHVEHPFMGERVPGKPQRKLDHAIRRTNLCHHMSVLYYTIQ